MNLEIMDPRVKIVKVDHPSESILEDLAIDVLHDLDGSDSADKLEADGTYAHFLCLSFFPHSPENVHIWEY